MKEIKALCAFCGASRGREDEVADFASAFGSACAARGIEIVLGGGGVGLMGRVGEAALAGGGRVTGIIPSFLEASEMPLSDLTKLVVVEGMHERKRKMFERADGFVSLPGGIGTLDETIEILTWRQLGLHDKPIVLVVWRTAEATGIRWSRCSSTSWQRGLPTAMSSTSTRWRSRSTRSSSSCAPEGAVARRGLVGDGLVPSRLECMRGPGTGDRKGRPDSVPRRIVG